MFYVLQWLKIYRNSHVDAFRCDAPYRHESTRNLTQICFVFSSSILGQPALMSERGPPSKRAKSEHTTLSKGPDMDGSDHENEMEALIALKNGDTDTKSKVLVGTLTPDSAAWRRSPYTRLDPNKDTLEIMQVDASQSAFTHKDGSAVINLYGITKEGVSVLLIAEHFHHYFYVPVVHKEVGVNDLRSALEAHLAKSNANYGNNRTRTQSTTRPNLVREVQVVSKKSIMYYIPGDAEVSFYKITLHHPRHLRVARDVFRNGGLRVKKRRRLWPLPIA